MSPVPMLALLIAALLGPMAGTRAADSIVKPDPPGVWRILGPDDKDTTSKCIGKPKTPICAVETFLACFVRDDESLCGNSAIYERPSRHTLRRVPFAAYRFVGSTRVGGRGWWRTVESRFGGHYRSILARARLGDLAVFVHSVPCHTPRNCIEMWRKSPPMLYAVRREGAIWRIVDNTMPVF
jgi:hypothetical protein